MSQDFWSSRKAAVAQEEKALLAAKEDAKRQDAQKELEAKSDEDILAELNLPDPDALTADDDFSVFMSKAVPDRIRRRALRVLWKANPILANLDELVEYGEDYTDSATVIENMQTAYQVGRGMLKHVEKLAEDAEKSLSAGAADEPHNDETSDDLEPDVPELTASVAHPEHPANDPDEAETEEPIKPRRMTFRTEDAHDRC